MRGVYYITHFLLLMEVRQVTGNDCNKQPAERIKQIKTIKGLSF